jgi:hypothetical protein
MAQAEGLGLFVKGGPCSSLPRKKATKKAINPMVGVTSKKGELQRTCLRGIGM